MFRVPEFPLSHGGGTSVGEISLSERRRRLSGRSLMFSPMALVVGGERGWVRSPMRALFRFEAFGKRGRRPIASARSAGKSPERSKRRGGSGQPKGRANSKQARVLALLCGPSGAAIATVTRSIGWHLERLRLCRVRYRRLRSTDRGLAGQPHRFGELCPRRTGAGASCPSAGRRRLGPLFRSRRPVHLD